MITISFVTDPDNVFVETFTVIHGIEKQTVIIPCKPTSKYVSVELMKDDEEVRRSDLKVYLVIFYAFFFVLS